MLDQTLCWVLYVGFVLCHITALNHCRWGVAVLDEGHKIRNPDSEVTLVAKQVRGEQATC